MLIPDDAIEREQMYDEVVEQCERSQEDRREKYETLRQFYLYGCAEGEESPFNKIYPHLDTTVSFLFASETTKFSISPDVEEPEPESWRSPVFGDALNERWHESNSDILVANSILWSLVFNSMILKINPVVNENTKSLQINPFSIHPAMFGVYREDVNTLDRQQAMVQTYFITEDELKLRLEGNPNKEMILASLSPEQPDDAEQNTLLSKIMMGQFQPVGNSTPGEGAVSFSLSSDMGYRPEQMDNLRCLKELWIWDDKMNDYRVVMRPRDGGMSIYDNPNFYLPGEHPFVQFCPRPLPFYFWGESEVGGLVGLQQWRNDYIAKIRRILALQLKPPTSLSGYGPLEEVQFAKWIEGSFITDQSSMTPNPKIEQFRPEMPQDVYRMINEIDNSFNEYSGLPNTVQGKGDAGVRSGKQADALARLGSARIKKRSLIIEDALEKMTYLMARLMQKHDDTVYKDTQQHSFVLNQFTKHYSVKVDGHSSSPVFVEDKRDLAFAMLERNLIKPERAIDMIDPPDKHQILRELAEVKKQIQSGKQAEETEELKKEALKHAPEGFMTKLLAKLFPG